MRRLANSAIRCHNGGLALLLWLRTEKNCLYYTDTVDCYDYPQYWDLSFRDETPLECDFFESAFQQFADGQVERILELGCGGGRNVVEMASRGYHLIGLDNNEISLTYLRKRLKRRGLTAEVMSGDMSEFELPAPVDAAICTFNTFRHLTSERSAVNHLKNVCEALKPGGIYILGFHIIPLGSDPDCCERWSAVHGKTKVTTTLKVVQFNREQRQEVLRFNLHVRKGEEILKLKSEYPYRLYTGDEFRNLLKKVPELEICEVYDFWYEIDYPVPFDHELTDAVFVLKKKGD